MATGFDRYRGESQGRIVPSSVDVPDGSRVFVLGTDGDTEPTTLTDGDYTQITQTVDLTSLDIIGANAETVGVAMENFVAPVGLQVESDTLSLWKMDHDYDAGSLTPGALNWVKPGPDLAGAGDIAQAAETYGPTGYQGLCRQVPVSSTTGQLNGVNTPAIIPGGFTTYTLDLWFDFDADAVAAANGGVATGIHPDLLNITTTGGGGLRAYLIGATGSKQWNVGITHQDGAGVAETRTFAAWSITANLGWKMLSIVYDAAETGVNRLKLYVDGVLASASSVTMAQSPSAPSAGEAFNVISPDLWGKIDQVRLSDTAHGAVAVLADYDQCVDTPTTHAAQWLMQVLIDGVVYAERVIAAGEQRTWRDHYAPVRHLTGDHIVAFRLKINEVT